MRISQASKLRKVSELGVLLSKHIMSTGLHLFAANLMVIISICNAGFFLPGVAVAVEKTKRRKPSSYMSFKQTRNPCPGRYNSSSSCPEHEAHGTGGLFKQRHSYFSEQKLDDGDTRVHRPDREHLHVRLRSFQHPSSLRVVRFGEDGESQDLQEALLRRLLGERREATEEQRDAPIHLLQLLHVPTCIQIRKLLLLIIKHL